MANTCPAVVRGCAIRVARLNANGSTQVGADDMYATAAFVSLSATPEIEAGEETTLKNACGGICVNYRDVDVIKRLNIELTLCAPDPELSELLAGGTVLTSGAAKGYGYPYLNDQTTPNGVAITVWSRQVQSDGSPDPTYPYIKFLMPRVYLTPGARTWENGAVTAPFTGYALENDQYGNGEVNDWPVASDRVLQQLPVATLPTLACSYQTSIAS